MLSFELDPKTIFRIIIKSKRIKSYHFACSRYCFDWNIQINSNN